MLDSMMNNYSIEIMTKSSFNQLKSIEEDFFNDIKSKKIKPAKLSETVSAFANASGGDIYIGIEEHTRNKNRKYDGFENCEEANSIIQMLFNLAPLENFYAVTFLKHPEEESYLLQLTIMKTATIVYATNKIAYVRNNARKDPVDTKEKLKRLELDKGIAQFENEKVNDAEIEDATESSVMKFFSENIAPNIEKGKWLTKQKLVKSGFLTVAGTLLFTDEPQITLAKRSAIKIFRYKTSDTADRDTLDGLPVTIEGPVYNQIYDAVSKVKETIEGMKRLGDGFEAIEYPDETLHEIITNAVLHRDYSIATDIQIRVFDSRVEVESPGKLPGYVTVKNILNSQTARNPKIVRLINKFPSAPNKDVGEGLNTAFEAMEKLRLKSPIIEETDNTVLVTIRHEKLASPEEVIIEYLKTNSSIKNAMGRTITGIKSENTMKKVFYRLRDEGFIKLVVGHKYWVKTANFDKLVNDQFK